MNNLDSSRGNYTNLLVGAVVVWVALFAFVAFYLQMDRLAGDAYSYYQDSQTLDKLNVYHLPLYPVLIAVFDLLLPFIEPIIIMTLINLVAWVAGIFAVYEVLKHYELPYPAIGALSFGAYPLVGLSYAVFPIADVPASAFVVLAAMFYLKQQRIPMLTAIAFGLLAHKVAWLFLFLIALVALYKRFINIFHVIVSGVPFLLYLVIGAIQHSDLLWFLRDTLDHTRYIGEERTIYPVFDTIIGRFAEGGAVSLLLGTLVLGICLVAILILLTVARRHLLFIAFAFPPLILAILMTAESSMVIIRFSKFLLIPLWYLVFTSKFLDAPKQRWLAYGIVGVSILSQFVFSNYVLYYLENPN